MLDTNSTSADTNTSAFATFCKTHFPGLRFPKTAITTAGKLFKNKGETAALTFLEGKGKTDPYNARPPAKCNILAWSRSPSEWPIALASRDVQRAVYALRLADYETLQAGFKETTAGRQFALHRLGLRHLPVHAQGLNPIISDALATYKGVLVKVANHNEKKAKKVERVNQFRLEQGFELETAPTPKVATNAEGFLAEPPGVNPCIQIYQQVSPRVVVHTRAFDDIPRTFKAYARDPDAPLRSTGKLDRLAIPPGMPGHVPAFQHPFLSRKKNRRQRAWYNNASNKPKKGRHPESPERAAAREQARDDGALLVSITIGADWLLLDARGLLRNVVYRGLATEGLSLQGLLDMFTGCPVVDPTHRVVTFVYKEGVVPIRKRKTVATKKAPELLQNLVAEHGTIGMVSVDLGQTNPLAACVSRIGEGLQDELVSQLGLTGELELMWARWRSDSDQLEARLRREAAASLTDAQQTEIASVKAYCPADGKRLLAERFGVDFSDVPWESMTSGTFHIADHFLRARPDESDLVHFHNKKKGRLKRTDLNIYRWTRPKLPKETCDALNAALWSIKTESPEYAKLSQRKRELSRRCANWVVREARRMTGCETIVVNVEDLNVRFFHGCGKRDIGWDHFFVPKRENRWLIQALHKALTELAPHHGVHVIESSPARTSITCPRCGLCDKKSRNGEYFHCVGCGVRLHADFEVAPANLQRVALTGRAMPKANSESLGGGQKTVGARKPRNPPKLKRKEATDKASSGDRIADIAAE